ncbi:MAG: DUF4974 domain-containing protein [Prevotella sp.]|jgi:hypothetical protein|nr:DUF4974 domain-containing protein [Prevotella sp.]MCH3992361.1 DUF4974 domain-containing protein [Prevotella sp.]MCI1473059.1 DUF4974 domain-containing protein [Prevotella sp.]MCI1518342.1 DUF4974 domain-containing protein [Prevotella sp.]MCI1548754.1 DUF4974 domain-containing protein [Prevotella sp.]MCI1595027.1 DUF4974 domain-containing protein [Prevotella sp.]
MEKIEQLIQMMEHPEQYSNDQWREILKDKDCREYYQLISETDNAIHDKPLSDKDVNRAQKNFESKYYSSTPHFLLLRKIAAIFIGLILISCIAIAAVSIVKHHQRTQTSLTHNGIINHKIKDSVKTVVMKTGSVKRKSTTDGEKRFVNVSLENILQQIAVYYHVKVSFTDGKATKIRLFFNWNQNNTLPQVVEQLNNFEEFHITLSNNTLTVK